MSGAEVIEVGAVDERVKAVIAQVPACGDEEPPDDSDGKLLESIRQSLQHRPVNGISETRLDPLPVVSSDQLRVSSLLSPLTAFHWFIEYGTRYGTHWENRATLVVPNTPAQFHPALCAFHLNAPLQMLIAIEDEMTGANSDVARLAFERAPQPKEILKMDGGHFGLLYYPSDFFEQASNVQRDFLVRYLK